VVEQGGVGEKERRRVKRRRGELRDGWR